MRPWHGQAASWPAWGTGAAQITTAAAPSRASRLGAGPSSGSARAGTLPVWVGPPGTTSSSTKSSGPSRRTATDASLSSSPVTRVTVGMASHATASALGVRGVVFTVARSDGGAGTAGRVHVSLDYAAFADAYGGNYAARIHLVELPACALTTPQLARCRKQIQPTSADNTKTGQVGADVTLPGLPASASAQLSAADRSPTTSASARLSAGRSPAATPAVLTSSVTPAGTETVIPSAQGALAGTYTQKMSYAPSGQELTYTDSAVSGLPLETVTTGYDSAGEPNTLAGTSPYVNTLTYTNLGQPLQYQIGTTAEPAYVTDSYDRRRSG
jgi:hypothetical protein